MTPALTPTLTPDLAARFAAVALGHVGREYPNKPGHVLAGPADARTPAALHPAFHGSYDWHSCVHGTWLLARVLRLFPDGPQAAAIRARFDAQLTPGTVAGECAYFAAPTARGFERPYGWGWLLKLADELSALPERRWSEALAPLAGLIVGRFAEFLPVATYPVRVGTHFNTAFALRLAADYAEGAGDAALIALLRDTAVRWYGDDADCPAWGEPGGDDFLSSALIEAECMRRLLPPRALRALVRPVPARSRGVPAGDPVPPGPRDRPLGREDRPSRRAEPQPRVVLPRARRVPRSGRSPPAATPRGRGGAPRGGPPARHRRLHGRALARDLRAAGPRGRRGRHPGRREDFLRDS
jgi:hypothetical protein